MFNQNKQNMFFHIPCYKSTEHVIPYSMLQKHRTCFLVYFTRNRFDARKQGAAAKKRCTFETFRRGCDIVLKLDVAPPVVTVAASPHGGGDAAMRAVAVGAPRERADNALLRVHGSAPARPRPGRAVARERGAELH